MQFSTDIAQLFCVLFLVYLAFCLFSLLFVFINSPFLNDLLSPQYFYLPGEQFLDAGLFRHPSVDDFSFDGRREEGGLRIDSTSQACVSTNFSLGILAFNSSSNL